MAALFQELRAASVPLGDRSWLRKVARGGVCSWVGVHGGFGVMFEPTAQNSGPAASHRTAVWNSLRTIGCSPRETQACASHGENYQPGIGG